MTDVTVSFQGWDSSLRGWNEGSWNSEPLIETVATTAISSVSVSISQNITAGS